jgi:tetratricopeptide (TPR) repeat protein
MRTTSRIFPKLLTGILATLMLSACSMGKMVVQGTQSIMDSSVETMNRETDLELAREAMPANLKLIEGMLIEDPGNTGMRLYAAEAFYGYAFGFIELEDRERASRFYRRCYNHALQALQDTGIQVDPESISPTDLEAVVGKAGRESVPALFWSASCLGKWIDLNRDKPVGIIEISSAAIMMQRVLELDDGFYYGGAHMFFGVYYGARSPMLGGNHELAEEHFRKAAAINQDRLLLVDLLQAEFLDRQRLDQAGFNKRLMRVIEAPDNLYPEMALINGIAKQRARHLLTLEDDWF